MKRKEFIKQLTILGIASQTIIYSCNDKKTIVIPQNHLPLTEKHAKILAYLMEILFPNDDNGPSVQQLNTFEYILWNLRDNKRDEVSKQYIINTIEWIEETSIEEKNKSFLELNDKGKENIIEFISKKSWGEDSLSAMLTLIFESLVYDPVYNVNRNALGWKWLDHTAGEPRPKFAAYTVYL